MKINIIGGGPAGLYFGILMKQQDPSHEIRIYERDGPNDTYGWGIVFSSQTFAYLHETDPSSHAEFTRACQTWDEVAVHFKGETNLVRGNRFSGIARLRFLNILQARCRELGIEPSFHHNVESLGELRDCDLLVGADGANSITRKAFTGGFQPQLAWGANKYIWLGTRHLLSGLNLISERHSAGLFAAHGYRFDTQSSTFIVECIGDTFERSDLANMSERETCTFLADIFKFHLGGSPLLSNSFVKWFNFLWVRNRNWWHENIVLLGDALHTAHFSIGSGTKQALEDAIALAEAFTSSRNVAEALPAFQAERKPLVDRLQNSAFESLKWFENVSQHAHLSPLEFTYRLMTRSGRIDKENLRRRDPEFVAAYDRERREAPPPG